MSDPISRAEQLRPKVLTTTELARYLRVHEVTIQRYCRQEKIPFLMVGGEYRFILNDVIEALKCSTKRELEDSKIFT